MTILNAYYMHTFIFIAILCLIVLYTYITCDGEKLNLVHILKHELVQAFYKSTKKFASDPLLRDFLMFSQKYLIINTLILHFITSSLYSYVGAILRNTTFHSNIRLDYQADYDEHTNKHYPNPTEAIAWNESDIERNANSW